ncbi:hypothetical protein YC2023_056636 [Brassica napus]
MLRPVAVGAGPVSGLIIPELSSNKTRGKITVERKGRSLEENIELALNTRDEVT